MQFTAHYSGDYSILMGIVDLVPGALFFLIGLITFKQLFNKVKPGISILYICGTVVGTIGGICKAIWKILVAANIVDFIALNKMQMPLQAISMVMMGIALVLAISKKNQLTKLSCVSLPIMLVLTSEIEPVKEYEGIMIFIVLLVVGSILVNVGYGTFAIRSNKKWLIILPIISFILSMVMGMSETIGKRAGMSVSQMNWFEEVDNILSQAATYVFCLLISKEGMIK